MELVRVCEGYKLVVDYDRVLLPSRQVLGHDPGLIQVANMRRAGVLIVRVRYVNRFGGDHFLRCLPLC